MMRRLIEDHLRRLWCLYFLYVTFLCFVGVFGIYFALTGWAAFFTRGFEGLAALAALQGTALFAFEMQRGAYDILRALPLSRRQLAGIAWLLGVVLPVTAVLVAVVPALLLLVMFRTGGWALSIGVILRMFIAMGVAGLYCLILGAMRLSRTSPEPFATWALLVCAAFWGLGIPLAVFNIHNLFSPEGDALLTPVLALAVVCILAAYPAIFAILRSGSGRDLLQSHRGSSKRMRHSKFSSRFLGVTAPWLKCAGLTMLFAAGCGACILWMPESGSRKYLVVGLGCGAVMGVFVATEPIISIKLCRTLPLTSRGLARLLLSLPLAASVALALIAVAGALLAGHSSYVLSIVGVLSVIVSGAMLLEPLQLRWGYPAQFALMFCVLMIAQFGYLFVRENTPGFVLLAALFSIPVTYIWLCRLIERDSQMYRRMVQYSQRWRGWR